MWRWGGGGEWQQRVEEEGGRVEGQGEVQITQGPPGKRKRRYRCSTVPPGRSGGFTKPWASSPINCPLYNGYGKSHNKKEVVCVSKPLPSLPCNRHRGIHVEPVWRCKSMCCTCKMGDNNAKGYSIGMKDVVGYGEVVFTCFSTLCQCREDCISHGSGNYTCIVSQLKILTP